MKLSFKDKIVVITGGTAGIGFSTAELFCELGAKVAICGVTPAHLQEALKLLRDRDYTVYGQICNVGDRNEMLDFSNNVETIFEGNINVWINNAGIYAPHRLINTTEEEWDRVINTNMKSVYLSGIIAYEKMREKGGVLINASSFAADMPTIGSGPYAPTKAAVENMIKVLAAELAPYNIRVCGYCPGDIATNMMTPLIEEKGATLLKAIPLNKFGEPRDVANTIAFLSSEYASYITGVSIMVTGGKFCVQNPAEAWKF
jgi:NAD(P)-dependent dehydrogenase (short-subunit alcohol dehydrogenase family)